MAIFNNQSTPARKDIPADPVPAFARDVPPTPQANPAPPAQQPAPVQSQATDFGASAAQRAPQAREVKESLIASGLTIEGKIEGAGHVRIAGQFKGDVNVQGDLTIERGARLSGGVRADKVIVAGELEGNIESAERVELLDSAVLTGDVKAGQLIVTAGSKIRGMVECGWGKETAKVAGNGAGNGKSNGNGTSAEAKPESDRAS